MASSRLLVFTWCMLCLVITAVYAGNLVAIATVDKPHIPFRTLEDLAQQNDYAVGTNKGGYSEDLMRNSKNPTLIMIYRKIKESARQVNVTAKQQVDGIVQRVLNEKYVCIGTRGLQDRIRSQTCSVVEIKETLFPVYQSFIFPPQSPLKKLFDYQILLLRESGLIDKLEQKWTTKPKVCDTHRHDQKVTLDQLKSALVACGFATVVATIALVTEMSRARQF